MIKSFGSDNEVIATFNSNLTGLHLELFSEGIEHLDDRWFRVVTSLGEYIK